METKTRPQASAKPPAPMLNEAGNFIRQYLVCSDYQAVIVTAWVFHTLSNAHVSGFRRFGVSAFRTCFGLVSGSFCEIVNKDAVCFGVSAFDPIFCKTSALRGSHHTCRRTQ